MKLFLGVCCLNRPFDDQRQTRIYLESAAVLRILGDIQAGRHELVRSDSLDLEVSRNPDPDRRARVSDLLALAVHHVRTTEREAQRARDLSALGFGAYDALHLACAESAEADVFLTTDDPLRRRARRFAARLRMQVANPVDWLTRIRS